MLRPVVFALLALALAGGGQASQAGVFIYTANLSGPAEAPPNASPGIGFTRITLDDVAHLMRIEVTFSGLLGNTTAAHVHAPTAVPGVGIAGVATELPSFTGFPLGVTSGLYDHTFDTSLNATWNTPFRNNNGGTALGAEAGLIRALNEGRAYLNVHSTSFPGGEIRGFPQAVPGPSTLALLASGGVALLGYTARRRRPTRDAALN